MASGKQARGGVLLYSGGWHNIGDIGDTPGTLRYLFETIGLIYPDRQVSRATAVEDVELVDARL